jgi:elongation factor 1-beta
MGNVALFIQVMPESPDVDREAIKAAIKEKVPSLQEIREEPIGFGLVALKVAVVVPDAEGEPDAVEAAIRDIPGVERAEIIESTLV